MNTRAEVQVYRQRYYIVATLFALIALSAMYMYLLSMTVVHVVMQKQINNDIHELNSEIAELESNYIEKQHSMSREVASMQGFVDTNKKIFIQKTDTNLALANQ